MTELQKELGYDGFLKELDDLESLLVNFINSYPLKPNLIYGDIRKKSLGISNN